MARRRYRRRYPRRGRRRFRRRYRYRRRYPRRYRRRTKYRGRSSVLHVKRRWQYNPNYDEAATQAKINLWPVIQKPVTGVQDTYNLYSQFWQWTWRIDDMLNWVSDFRNTFRYYKLNYVKLEFVKKVDTNILPFAAESSNPKMDGQDTAFIPYIQYLRIPDMDMFDDKSGHRVNSKLTAQKLFQHEHVRRIQLGRNFSIGIRPYTQRPAYERSSLGWAYQPVRGQWFQTEDDVVPYYGLLYFINATDIQNPSDMWKWFTYDVFVTYYFSVKGIR